LAQHGPAEQGSVGTKCQSHWEATWIQNGWWGWLLCSLFPCLWICSTKNFAIHLHSTSTCIAIPIFRAKNVPELGHPGVIPGQDLSITSKILYLDLLLSHNPSIGILALKYKKNIVRASPPQACKHPFSWNLAAGWRESCCTPVLMAILQRSF
jgi:hypothetical protein